MELRQTASGSVTRGSTRLSQFFFLESFFFQREALSFHVLWSDTAFF